MTAGEWSEDAWGLADPRTVRRSHLRDVHRERTRTGEAQRPPLHQRSRTIFRGRVVGECEAARRRECSCGITLVEPVDVFQQHAIRAEFGSKIERGEIRAATA